MLRIDVCFAGLGEEEMAYEILFWKMGGWEERCVVESKSDWEAFTGQLCALFMFMGRHNLVPPHRL